MRRLRLPCTACRNDLRDEEIVRFETFRCPHCGTHLKVTFPYESAILRIVLLIPLVLMLKIWWEGGGFWWAMACIPLQFVLMIIMLNLKHHVFPLQLKEHKPAFTRLDISSR